MTTAPVTDRPTHATKALVQSILEQNPQGLTDDALWLATGLDYGHHGSVVKRRQETGAVKVGRGVSRMGRKCNLWALP